MIFDTLNPLKGDFKPNQLGAFYVDDQNGGGDGNPPADKPWFDSLPDPIKTDPNITKYKNLDEFATGHLNAVKLVGAKGVIVPKPDAPPEEHDKFYNSLGRPEKPEGYKLSPMENLHKSIQITPESQKVYMEQMHKLGLTNSQADNLNKWYMGVLNQALTSQDQAHEAKLKEVGTKLQQEWGKDYQLNVTMANRLLEKFGGKETAERFLGENADPQLLKVFASVAKVMSEDHVNSLGFSSLASSASEAKQKIREIESNLKHAYYDADHPDHNNWVGENGEMRRLYKIAEGIV
jgi:hypothetical protein